MSTVERLWEVSERVARAYARLPGVTGVVTGGSLARGFADARSDIELYVYHRGRLPSKKAIAGILDELHAVTTRSEDVHWHHPAWGYHSFFGVAGVKVELGYREVDATYERMKRFRRALVLPKHGIHDTPFGHYESGVANCIRSCRVLYDRTGEIRRLKALVEVYPKRLRDETLRYYHSDAETLCAVKLRQAVERDDAYLFNACVARILRSVVIVIFTLNDEYYPGDKWNEKYLEKFQVKPVRCEETLAEILRTPQRRREDRERVFRLLTELIDALPCA